MKRTAYSSLQAWKTSPRRKPLLLRGARQTGKTWLLREFGRREFGGLTYLDFEADPRLAGLFDQDLDPHRILKDLALYRGEGFDAARDLLVFDEIQACDRALTSLKYFRERAPEIHVAAAGSLLGVRLSKPGSFPVGQVNFLDLDPMSFPEYLCARGRDEYAARLQGIADFEPLPLALHEELIDLLREYHFVGGMPEAVRTFADARDADATREVQLDICDSFLLDFAKHAPPTDIPKLGLIWDSIPRHLAKENRKFMFSALRKGARARAYENALRWLHDAGLARPCYAVSSDRRPLSHYEDRSCFKIYPLDVGLLGAMTRTPAEFLLPGERMFTEYRGALTESYVAQQLVAANHRGLHYWRSTGGRAEVDFLVEAAGGVVPVEVKAGRSRKSRSLRSYDQQFSPELLVRTSLRGMKRDGKIANIPLYAASEIPRLAHLYGAGTA